MAESVDFELPADSPGAGPGPDFPLADEPVTTPNPGTPQPEAPTASPHWLVQRLVDFALLMRLDRPIGIWLLLWPTLWALWSASGGHPQPRLLAIFLAGTVLMRSAGCVINDLFDRDIDPHVRRTRSRPLAARRVAPGEALALFAALVGAAFLLVLQLNALCLKLSLIGAALTVSYPLLKRFFPIPDRKSVV